MHSSLKHLKAGASIIATGSLAASFCHRTETPAGWTHGPGGAGYGFAKQVVSHYVNNLALQLAPEFIRVNAVHPTNVNTDLLHSEDVQGVPPRPGGPHARGRHVDIPDPGHAGPVCRAPGHL